MDEFNSRIDAQRHVLQIVNCRPWAEQLFGLSNKAIQRWVSVNKLEPNSATVAHVNDAAGELFFLANHSEDQISKEYVLSARRIAQLALAIKADLELSQS